MGTTKIMSDSEDFSEDEGGKQKFQPTLSVEDQPLEVIKRVKALKKLQFKNIKHEVRYYKELTKEYLMKNTFDPEDPLDFDGPEIYKSKGCKIGWKAGKNTTVKVIKQKQKSKGKGKGGQKFTTKQEKRESFFNFFSPPKVPDNEDDIEGESEDE